MNFAKNVVIAVTFVTAASTASVEVCAQTYCRPGDTVCQHQLQIQQQQAQEVARQRQLQMLQQQAQQAARQRQLQMQQLQMQQQQAQEAARQRQLQQQQQQAQLAERQRQLQQQQQQAQLAERQRQLQIQQQQAQQAARQRQLQQQQLQAQQATRQHQPQHEQGAQTSAPGPSPPQTAGSSSVLPGKAASQHLDQSRVASAGESHVAPRATSASLGGGVTAVGRPRSSQLTVTQAKPDGSKIVMNLRFAGNKAQIVNAYATQKDVAHGTVTRTYLDGHKLIKGKAFTQFKAPGGYSLTTHADGLREAYRPDGRPLYREQWQTQTVHGVETRVIARTVYSERMSKQTVIYRTPIVRTYAPETYFGVPVFAYQPVVFAPAFYEPFRVGFAQPLSVTAACLICPAPVVAFARPVQQYSDPVALVGDLQITSAVTDGAGNPQVADKSPPPASDPEVAQVVQQVAALLQQVDSAKADNPDLRSQIDSLQGQQTGEPTARSADASVAYVAYTIPEGVRQQIHRQVRDNIELHESNQPLTWPYLVSSGKAQEYVFQVSEMTSAVDTDGEECSLSGGDLLRLDTGAAPDESALRMRVVTSKATSCDSGTVVNISVADAQGMLNDFNARQETIMKKVQPELEGSATNA